MSTVAVDQEWISGAKARQILGGISARKLEQIVTLGYLEVRSGIEGSQPRYATASVFALRDQIVKPATKMVATA